MRRRVSFLVARFDRDVRAARYGRRSPRSPGSQFRVCSFARDELFERLDGLPWVGHRVELVLDAVSRALECAVVKEHANGFAG